MINKLMPHLETGEYAVLMCKGLTGQVLKIDRQVSTDETDEIFVVFRTLPDAYSYIEKINSLDSTIEFCIYDEKHQLEKYIKAPAYI
jgi:hypothetical protein